MHTCTQICYQVASLSHLRLVHGDFKPASTRHQHLIDTPRTHHTPPRGYATWRTFPSCVTWMLPCASVPHTTHMSESESGQNFGNNSSMTLDSEANSRTDAPIPKTNLVESLHRAGAVVVASSPQWGWVLLSSPLAEIGAKKIVTEYGGKWVGSVWDASKDELSASGLPIARERPATSALTASRLISSALRPAVVRGKRVREGVQNDGDDSESVLRGARGSPGR